MKTIRYRSLFFFLLAFLAAGALTVALAQLRIGSYSPQHLGTLSQPTPAALSDNATYEVPAYPAFPVELAPGDGRAEVQISCATCHTPRYITMQPPMPAAAWDAEVHKMIKTYGASISEADAQKIIQYLGSHYSPETRK
jgi:mono/diheme cytochrome c family protein